MDSVMVQRIWWYARGFMDFVLLWILYLYKYIQFIIYPETLKFYALVIGVRSRSCKVGFIKRRLWKFLRILWKGLCCIEEWNVEMLFSSYNNFLFVILYLRGNAFKIYINKISLKCREQTGEEDKRKAWIKLGIAYYEFIMICSEENLF